MKKSSWKPLFLVLIFGICLSSYSQSRETYVKQDPKLDSLLNKKITLELKNGLVQILFTNTAEAGKKQNNQPKNGH